MDTQKVDLFLASKSDFFEATQLPLVRQKLLEIPDDKFIGISAMEFKNPTTVLIISILVGGLGVDRFMIGDTGMGVVKLLTCGICGILTIIDWFTIRKKTREYNYKKFINGINLI